MEIPLDRFLGITGVVLAIIGLFAAYIFYRRSLRFKEPLYSISSNNLIRDNVTKMSGLEINYKGHTVENLTVSKILFWNNGSATLEKNDIATANPLRIECTSDNLILDTQVLKTNNASSQFSIELLPSLTTVAIGFDYFDKGQGALMQIVHTGKSSADLTLKGDIKGATIHFHKSKRRFLSKLFDYIGPNSIIILTISAIFLTRGMEIFRRVSVILLTFVLSFVVLFTLASWAAKRFGDLFPKDFKDFE